MSAEATDIEAAVSALEAQRSALGDAVVDVAIRALLAQAGADDRHSDRPRLRQASVMFVDIVGSTSIGAALDPEDIHAVMNRIADDFTRVVTGWFGRVVKYTGDGLLAVFGIDAAQEQAAEHAIRAGLDMLAAVPAIRAEMAERIQRGPLDARVGVHTGLVLVGGGVEGAANIRGTAVNIAARMEQNAPPGGLRISHDTFRQVRGLFDLVSESPITLKGVDSPVQTYLVTRARPNAFRAPTRGIDGVETPMVGRTDELARLQRSFDDVLEMSQTRRHLVIGDAGLGKSRLLAEFRQWAEVQGVSVHWFAGRAQVGTRSSPYGLLSDLLRGWLRDTAEYGDHAGDGDGEAFRNAVEPLLGEAATRFVGKLVGFEVGASTDESSEDAQQLRHRAARSIARLFEALARDASVGRPIVILLEDLHWADDSTLDAIEYLARVGRDIPLLIIGTTRPQLVEQRPHVLASLDEPDVRLMLQSLDDSQAEELVGSLLARLAYVPDDLRRRIVESGGGVPFFLEEIVRMLLDGGTIRVGESGWQLADDHGAVGSVPDTLAGVLQARLDALEADELAAAQRAAVLGHVFTTDGVVSLGGRADAIDGLLTRGIAVAEHVDPGGTEQYAFRHHLLHQFVYDSLLKTDRRSHHAAAAAWLARTTPQHMAAIGEHHERAGSMLEAVSWFARAADEAADRHAQQVTVDLVGKALALVPSDDAATRWRLVAVRERMRAIGDDRASHHVDLVELARLADVLDDNLLRAEAACRLASSLVDIGDYDDARAASHHGIAWLSESAVVDPGLLARLEMELAAAHLRLADFSEARRFAEQALARTRDSGATSATVRAALRLSAILGVQGENDEAAALVVEAWDLAQAIGDRLGQAEAAVRRGTQANTAGELDLALLWYAEAVVLSREIGWVVGEAAATLNQAMTMSDLTRFDEALERGRAASDAAALAGSRDLEAAAESTLAFAALQLGSDDVARRGFERSHELFRLNGSEHYMLTPTAGLAMLDLRAGDVGSATRRAHEVAAHIAGGATLAGIDFPLVTALFAGRVFAAVGDNERADLVLAEGMRLIDAEPGPRPGDPDDHGSWDRRAVVAAWNERHPAVASGDPPRSRRD